MLTTLNNNVLLIEPRLWLSVLDEIKAVQASGIRTQSYRAAISSRNGLDVVNISGVLLPNVPPAYREWGINATGYDEITEAVTAAAESSSKAILLNINSGGGLVTGIDTALAAIRQAAGTKPVLAYVDGLAASAAYWLASQATGGIYATRLSEVGSIGAYTVMYDTSKAAEIFGERAVVSRSGDQKGAGIFGDPITGRMKDVQDDAVSDIASMFMADVTAVRTQINPADANSGRTWLAERAKELGLIDGVVTSSRDIAIPSFQGASACEPEPITPTVADGCPTKTEEKNTMPETSQDAVLNERVRVREIAETFAADPDFARMHIDAGSTLAEAKAEHYDVVMARAKAVKALGDAPRPVASGEPAREPEEDFITKARRIAFEQGKPLHLVVADLARIDRAAYLAYVGAKKEA